MRIDEVCPSEIVALWQASGGRRDCSGTPVRTMTAPPSTFLTLDRGGDASSLPLRQNLYRFTSVSYIRLPNNLPPDGASSPWLAAEGLLELVWGGGKWFSSSQADMSSYVLRAKSRRNIIKNGHATAYIAIPPRRRYPDQIAVNGTDYHSANTISDRRF